MTTQKSLQVLIKKINQLNAKIEIKIRLKESYKKEAVQHKLLLEAIREMERSK